MLLDIVAVKPLSDYSILLTFENGEKKVFDVKPILDRPRWQELKDISLFNTVKVWEGTVQWIHEQDINGSMRKEKVKSKHIMLKRLMNLDIEHQFKMSLWKE